MEELTTQLINKVIRVEDGLCWCSFRAFEDLNDVLLCDGDGGWSGVRDRREVFAVVS